MFRVFSLVFCIFFFLSLGFETNAKFSGEIVPVLMLSPRSDIQVRAFQKDAIEFLISDDVFFKTRLKEV